MDSNQVLLKEKLLNMLEWFDKFCEENSLRYYALGGTMLGAIRHHGFIPWDDDIDVGMPRPDFNKFVKLMKIENKSNAFYYFESPYSSDPKFNYTYGKLYDKNTTLIENTKSKIIRGIFIDIFPLDGIGNTKEESYHNYKRMAPAFNLYLARTCAVKNGKSLLRNIAIVFASMIPNRVWNIRSHRLQINSMCQKLSYDDSLWIGNLTGAWGIKEIMPKSVLGEPTEYKFEHLRVYGAEDPNSYLTYLYGDWRKLPPKEKRVSHHDFCYFSLTEPYAVHGKKNSAMK